MISVRDIRRSLNSNGEIGVKDSEVRGNEVEKLGGWKEDVGYKFLGFCELMCRV